MVQQHSSSIQLDHIVILLPHRDLLDPPAWITENFTLSPGGQHADGKTENKLVLLRDGTYIEFISFINDEPVNREGHWWGDKQDGVIDWAFTSPDVEDLSRVTTNLEEWNSKQGNGAITGLTYAQPQPGGRRKQSGQEIAWFLTSPSGVKRGVLPFWCHDVTPREQRVPVEPQGTQHPCGAVGINNLVVATTKTSSLHGAYNAILASPGQPIKEGFEWTVEAPRVLPAHPASKLTLWASEKEQRASDIDAEIIIELAVQSGGETKAAGPISEKFGSHGERQLQISFARTERSSN